MATTTMMVVVMMMMMMIVVVVAVVDLIYSTVLPSADNEGSYCHGVVIATCTL